jgi:hypothetical protein
MLLAKSSQIPLNLHAPPADNSFDLLVRLLKGKIFNYAQFLESNRIPLNLHAPPADDTFDLLVRLLKGKIFNSS